MPTSAIILIVLTTLAFGCAHDRTEHQMEPLIEELTSVKPAGLVEIAGRRIAYAEYGAPGGRPVFYFSGGDSSRLEGRSLHESAAAAGVRIIAPDRPGFGGSDFQPERTLSDWPSDVAALADHLGFRDFAVIGLSGGGPHAFVTAWALPNRVTHLVVVGSAPPPSLEPLARDIAFPFRMLAWFTRNARWALAKILAQQQTLARERPEKLLKQTRGAVGPADARYLSGDGGVLYAASKRLAYQAGADGSLQEHLLYRADWGFDLSAIDVPTTVFVGAEDVMASRKVNRILAETVPGARFVEVAGEGHLSMVPNQGTLLLDAALGRTPPRP